VRSEGEIYINRETDNVCISSERNPKGNEISISTISIMYYQLNINL